MSSPKKSDYAGKLYYSCRDVTPDGWGTVAPPPPKIMFELANQCNHRCVFCANRHMKRPPGLLPREIFERVSAEAREHGIHEIALYTTGESLLHPELTELIATAKSLGFTYIYLSTNGALLTPELSRAIILAGLDSLRFSINAGTRESYRRVHGSDDFDRVIANLREYDAIRKELGSPTLLSASCVLTTLTSREKEQIEGLLGPHVDAIKWTDVRIQGGLMVAAARKLTLKQNDDRYGLRPCGLLWNGIHVDNQGNMTLCCVDFEGKMLVGNILERGLMGCWNGPEMQEHRRLHLSGGLDRKGLCYRCLIGFES